MNKFNYFAPLQFVRHLVVSLMYYNSLFSTLNFLVPRSMTLSSAKSGSGLSSLYCSSNSFSLENESSTMTKKLSALSYFLYCMYCFRHSGVMWAPSSCANFIVFFYLLMIDCKPELRGSCHIDWLISTVALMIMLWSGLRILSNNDSRQPMRGGKVGGIIIFNW